MGDQLDAIDQEDKWYIAEVMDAKLMRMKGSEERVRAVLVHYLEWSHKVCMGRSVATAHTESNSKCVHIECGACIAILLNSEWMPYMLLFHNHIIDRKMLAYA